jgi:nitrite reductase (NADH) small subunit
MEITLGPLTSIPLGEGRTFDVGARKIAVFRTRQGQIYAAQADCPHRGGPLADGILGSAVLVCPLHSWKFDLATGRSLTGDCAIKTYPARLGKKGQILVDLAGSEAAESAEPAP